MTIDGHLGALINSTSASIRSNQHYAHENTRNMIARYINMSSKEQTRASYDMSNR